MGKPISSISFTRFMRADALPAWRPVERTPRLSPVLASAIAHRPTVLVLNLGAWEYEDGCNDMHSLHDALCNATRPWILSEYTAKWMLIAAALKSSYGRGAAGTKAARGGLVVWRSATPRDFEGGVAKQGGRCRRRAPFRPAELASLEGNSLDPTSMRFAVLTKNVIMDAVAAQRAPWVRILDAYSIARQRADAHPGPDPKTNRHGSLHPRAFDDCLHYCLPGVPDLYNGRLLTLLEKAATSSTVAPAAFEEGVPGSLYARWNFPFGGQPFVNGALSEGGLRLRLDRDAPPAPLECPLPYARGGPYPPAADKSASAAAEPLASAPLLGFCSDIDPPTTFRRANETRGGGVARSGRHSALVAELKSEAGKAKRASKAELLSKRERSSLRSTRRNASSDGAVGVVGNLMSKIG